MDGNTARTRPRVVVIGAGFAGLNCAKRLRGLPVDVTIVDRHNHHLFQPLLYQVALAVLAAPDIAAPIRAIFAKDGNVEVIMDEAVGFDLARRRVLLKTGAELAYDYVVLAAGASHSYFGHDEWAALAPGLKTVEDALEIRRRVLLAFELAERQMLEEGSHPPLNFVVVGGGPTGVELAGAISDIARVYMKHDFRHIDPTKIRVLLLEGGPRILAAYPPDLSESAVKQLEDLHVEVRTGAHVTDIEPGYVRVGDETIPSVVTLWGAGVKASPLGALLGAPTDRSGRVLVDRYLNIPGHPEVFVLGDMAHFEQNGEMVPGVAPTAIQMGTYAAKAIRDNLEGRPRKPFHYWDKGTMATIGRDHGIGDVHWPFKMHLTGFVGWLGWLLIHIAYLISFRNRLLVLLTWAWTYFTFQRGARIISGSQTLPGWNALPGAQPNQMQPAEAVPPDHRPTQMQV